MATVVVTSLQVIWETRRLAKNWQCNSCLFWGCQKYDNIELWNGQYCTCQMEGNQYCPWSILVSPPPAWLHSTRTRAIRSFIALAWGGHDLVHNVRIVPPNPRGDENTGKYCPRPSSWIGGYNTDTIHTEVETGHHDNSNVSRGSCFPNCYAS